MIDKEKLNEIAIYYSTILMRAEEHDSKPFYQKGFKEGVYWMMSEFLKENMFYKAKDKRIQDILKLGYARITNEFLKSLWHDASEEPSSKYVTILTFKKLYPGLMIYNVLKGYHDWNDEDIDKWLYIDDILPKEGGKG